MSLDVVTVSIVPMLSKLSVDNVREQEKQGTVASPDVPAGHISDWVQAAMSQP